MRPVTWVALGVTLAALLAGEELWWRQRDAAVVARVRAARRAVRPGTCRSSLGGGARLSDRVWVDYSMKFVGDTGRVRMAVVARGQAGWQERGGRRPAPSPSNPGPVHTSGGSIDSVAAAYDALSDAAWPHTKELPLGDKNLVLVDRVDGVGGPPVVVGALEMPPVLIPGTCDDADGGPGPAVREAFERIPAVRRLAGLGAAAGR